MILVGLLLVDSSGYDSKTFDWGPGLKWSKFKRHGAQLLSLFFTSACLLAAAFLWVGHVSKNNISTTRTDRRS